ncbi:putative wall-associated receptor kinase-like 16 [Prosopis cineraria]|uniref:putative wall-associated receptor kinase-like 16 n=1 Tax=Prosopis cineraria TaxID=364024 RepID=UPI00240EA783|nr:putative wall-associated receptor kinase-like 16 [Prosopis cineraria]
MGLKLLFLILLAAAMAEVETQSSLEGCPRKCGDLEIPYPFGVGIQPSTGVNCFLEESFNLTCDNSTSKLLYRDNLQISSISPQAGQMEILMNISKICQNRSGVGLVQHLRTDDFTVSSTQNKFVTIGCDTLSITRAQNSLRQNESYFNGCATLCEKPPPEELNDKTCTGTGCCQVDIPAGMNSINFTVSTVNFTNVSSFNNCSYAFVAKSDWFKFSVDYLDYFPHETAPIVLDWTVSNLTCRNSSISSDHCACKDNTDLVRSDDGYGYNCKCKTGFEGNPYHPDGCRDFDECNASNNCSISTQALCHNFDGGYSCSCPPGYTGDGYVNGTHCTLKASSHSNLRILIIALGIVVVLLVVFTLASTTCLVHKRRTLKQIRQRNFEQNGGNLLQQHISQQQSYAERIKIFTEIELKNATNNFDEGRILGCGGQGIVYKGILPDNTHVAIKKSRVGGDARQIKDFINEVFVLSQINHRNVVKILGCCLETEVPLLVYEFVDNGTLFDHIDPSKTGHFITWESRLRIAAETVEAILYLHSAASIPIIHRDIKSTNILLDHNDKAKVSDFGASRLVPLDETQITTVVQGTLGYLDPEYLHTGQLNEKSDVYSFGVVLVELLTGNKAVAFNRPELRNLAMYFVSSVKENCLWEILDRRLEQKKNAKQLKDVALLALRCLRVNGQERPTMKEVALELQNMIAVEMHPWVKDEAMKEEEAMKVEESEYLLGHVPNGYGDASTSISVASHDSTQKQIAFEIANGR